MTLVTFDTHGTTALICLNRPEVRNAVNLALTADLRTALARFDGDPALRVAVLTGAGRFFCAGMDLGAFAAGERPGLDDSDGFAGFVRATRTKPVIAAVNGGAVAGGFEIVLACDMVVAETGAILALPEVKRGLFAAGGGALRLPRRLPAAIAAEILLTGDPITADRAAALGLVNAVVPGPDLIDTALALAARVAGNAPMALRLTRAVAQAAEDWGPSTAAWAQIESSADALEGARAFKEKRTPRWTGV
ncbi:MAG: enoyl-CoA hydratase/isomerase family protein [Rhodobacter sp.]|nr:enoyl-CoA hydratase/isomerase family protein [Rhodobacter sp.]